MPLLKILLLLTLSGLALLLGGCQSNPMIPSPEPVNCQPSAPQLEWHKVADGGVYYPPRSVTNLMLYIEALNACITQHQAN